MPDSMSASRVAARRVTTTALLASMLAASAAITVPFGTVPATLQVLFVALIALVVPRRWAVMAVGAYLLVGAIGLPVFSGMRGGIAVLVGPTGGYLLGFLAGASVGAWTREQLGFAVKSVTVVDSIAATVTVTIVYALGWLQLALVAGMDPVSALLTGVVPFLIPDALKVIAAVVLAPTVRRAIAR